MNLDDLLNIREASELTGKSEMTIRKYLGLTNPPRASRLPNARKVARPGESLETWQIPVSDLFNAGLMKQTPGDNQATIAPADNSDQVKQLQAEIEQLKLYITALQNKELVLEQSNADLRDALADLRFVLGRSIETKETQEARVKRWKLFKRSN